MKKWNYWPYITMSFLAVAFFMTGMTIYIAVTKVPVELDGRFQMKYQDVNEQYLDLQNARDAFDEAGYKIQVELPRSLHKNTYSFKLIGPKKPTNASLVISRPATNLDQLGPFVLSGGPHVYSQEITLAQAGCWVFDLKFEVEGWTIFERNSIYFNEDGTLQTNRTCGRK